MRPLMTTIIPVFNANEKMLRTAIARQETDPRSSCHLAGCGLVDFTVASSASDSFVRPVGDAKTRSVLIPET